MAAVSRFERSRGAAVDRRIISAALETYAEKGWAGFSIVAVAQRARAGKASIYARWPNRKQLLTDALQFALDSFVDIDTGTVHSDLVALTETVLRSYLGPPGRAALRITLDAHLIPDLAREHAAYWRAQLAAGRVIVDRAMERGELPAGSATHHQELLHSLLGAALFYAVIELPGQRLQKDQKITEFAETVAALALHNMGP
jgi:AcrR family transcriptional regulator